MTDFKTSISQIFKRVESQVSIILLLQGFEFLERMTDPDAFDSEFTIWINNQNSEAIRFTWDGKEGWFVLEESPIARNLETWQWPWADILLLQIDKADFSKEKIDSIVNQLVNELK